ncbi:MAG: DUF131 domain-containing protein [Candidatus Diapherotrites archaeon]
MLGVLGAEKLFILGILLIIFGLTISAVSVILSATSEKDTKVEGAAIVMIGPIPIMFGSKRLLVPLLLVVLLFLFVLLIIYLLQIWRT